MTDVQYESIIKFVSLVWGAYFTFWGASVIVVKAWKEIRKAEIQASIQIAQERSEGDKMMREHDDRIQQLERRQRELAQAQHDQLIEVMGELRK